MGKPSLAETLSDWGVPPPKEPPQYSSPDTAASSVYVPPPPGEEKMLLKRAKEEQDRSIAPTKGALSLQGISVPWENADTSSTDEDLLARDTKHKLLDEERSHQKISILPKSQTRSPIVFPKLDEGGDGAQGSSVGGPELLGLAQRGATSGGHGAYESSTVSPAREAALHEAQDEGMHLAAHQGYAEAKAEDSKAQAQQDIMLEQQKAQQQQQQMAQQRYMQAQQNLEKTQKTYDDLAKQPEVNPDRWWDNQSTGAKIGYAFAAALAGFGQGWNHDSGPNPVIQHIKDAVQQDVAAQADNYHRKEKLADTKNTLYAQAYGLTGDRNQALILANQLGIESQIRKAQAVEHSAAAPVVKAHATQVINELQKGQIEEDIKHHPMVQAAPGAGKYALEEQKARQHFMDASLAAGKPVDPKGLEQYVQYAVYGLSPGHELSDIAKHRAGSAASDTLNSTLSLGHEIEQSEDHGSTRTNPVVRAHLENWFQNTDGAARLIQNRQYNAGVLSAIRSVAKLRGGLGDLEKLASDFTIERGDGPQRIAEKISGFERFVKSNSDIVHSADIPQDPDAEKELSEDDFKED